MPTAIMPPTTGSASKTETRKPLRTRVSATAMPAGPAPTTATRFAFGASTGAVCSVASSGFCNSQSETNRFRRRIDTASSTSARRQLSSQGWVQIRPQMPAKGMAWRIRSRASRKRPWAISAI